MANKEGEPIKAVDILKCGVCLERYRRPKLLPCFHTYCQRCVEKLAGTKPSFPCPACRTNVVIPPGGAANLQANFYLEKDLAKEEAQEGSECQLCSKGKQAQYKCVQCQQVYCAPCRGLHDSIESCTQHTILPVGGSTGELGGEGVVMETKCAKHKNQLLLLFCCRCEVSICIHCKLTSHDGHETEDVIDTDVKAKARLQDECHSLDQRRHLLEAMLAKADDFHGDLDQEKRTAEQEIHERASQLQQMVSQAQEEGLKSVQSAVEIAANDLKEQTKPITERHAAVVAKRQHILQVIDQGNAEEAVGLVTKLRLEPDNAGKGKSGQDNLVIQRGTVGVGYRPRAVRYTDILSFIGVAKEGPLVETKAVSFEALQQQEPVQRRLKALSQSALGRGNLADHGAVPFREIVYSNNPRAAFYKMCLTSDGGLWVIYNPGGNVYHMSLFSDDGQCLETIYEDFTLNLPYITCDGDTIVSLYDGKWVRPGGERGILTPAPNRGGSIISKSLTPYLLWPNVNVRSVLRITSVTALSPVIDTNVFCTYPINGSYNFDVSADERFYAFCTNPVTVYDKNQATTNLRSFANYTPADGAAPTDVCFCEVDGREMLIVAYTATNSVHVVDHKDGCCFVRRLESDGCKLDRPQQLATNHQGRVWVGCHGGKIVCFDL